MHRRSHTGKNDNILFLPSLFLANKSFKIDRYCMFFFSIKKNFNVSAAVLILFIYHIQNRGQLCVITFQSSDEN